MSEPNPNPHQHTGKIYMANGKIVCKDCHEDKDKGLNECFDACHAKGKLSCPGCIRFHIPAGDK